MIVRDKKLKKNVNVSEKGCPTFQCYWPRLNPGSFVQGRGYRSYGDERDKEWLCGTREVHNCPDCPQILDPSSNED